MAISPSHYICSRIREHAVSSLAYPINKIAANSFLHSIYAPKYTRCADRHTQNLGRDHHEMHLIKSVVGYYK